MTQSLSAAFKAYWSKRMQMMHKRIDIFRQIASFEEQDQLKHGDTVHRPYRSSIKPQTYTRGTAVTIRELTNTDESLQVTTAKVVPFYVDDLDELQSSYKNANEYADDAAQELSNVIDGDVLAESANAASKVDNVEIAAGTAGDAFTLSISNVQKVFVQAKAKLRKQHVKFREGELFGVISPEFEAVLLDYLAGKESVLGDKTGLAGNVGTYLGFDLYVSDSVLWTGELAYNATTPTDTDTVTINGVVFTFKTTLGSTAGNVLAVTDGVTSFTNLQSLINAPGTTTANGVALTAANQDLMFGITAAGVSGATGTLTVTAKGWGTVVVSETLTPAADVWTTNRQIQHQLFGKKGATDVVIMAEPKLEVKEVPDKLGKNFLPYTLYGKKTFVEGTKKLVDVRVNAVSFTASNTQ